MVTSCAVPSVLSVKIGWLRDFSAKVFYLNHFSLLCYRLPCRIGERKSRLERAIS
jgi:hypothetical protein